MLDPIQEIKERLDIVEIISSYIKLDKAGANFKACCPFHNEKTPSFVVSPSKQIWHCFGACDIGGDIFSFVQEIEGIDFREALRMLAERAGVELKKQDPKIQNERTRLLEINQWAVKYFQKCLDVSPSGKKAFKYLKNRGLIKKSIKKFQLGYSPDNWHALGNFLNKKNYTDAEISKAGLVVRKQDGTCFDRFRARIMFPILDMSSQVVGFTGRIMPGKDDKMGKYVNTPETTLYNKSRVLYGLDKAKVFMRKKDSCILVEGNLDVIMAHQAGDKNTIACSGTALTSEQLKIIKRYTNNLLLNFDADDAGISATRKNIDLALCFGFDIKIICLGKYEQSSRSSLRSYFKDAADCIMENPKAWKRAVKNPSPIMDFYFQSTFSKMPKKLKVEHKREAAKILLPIIKRIPNLIEKSHWMQDLAMRLEVDEKILLEAISKTETNRTYPQSVSSGFDAGAEYGSVPNAEDHQSQSSQNNLEAKLTGLLLKYPKCIKIFTKQKIKLENKEFAKIIANIEKIPKNLKKTADKLYLKIEHEYQDLENPKNEIKNFVLILKKQKIQEKLKSIGFAIKTAEVKKNSKKIQQLTKKAKKLSQELAKCHK